MNFFEELENLRRTVPHPAILTVNSENSEYCPYMAQGKNSYMCIGHNMNEDCYYNYWLGFSRDCVDNSFTENSELCYECVYCQYCYDCNSCQECRNCSSCRSCYDCAGCESCFGSVNLRQKRFHIFNEPVEQSEYKGLVEYYTNTSKGKAEAAQRILQLQADNPRIAMQQIQVENCVGDHVYRSKNAYQCFDVSDGEDVGYVFNGSKVKDCYDVCYTGQNSELDYDCMSAVTLRNSNFCTVCWYSDSLEYCEYVFNSKYCFGCVSRNHAQYEILNVPYEPDEYFRRVEEIRQEMRSQGLYGKHLPSVYPEYLSWIE